MGSSRSFVGLFCLFLAFASAEAEAAASACEPASEKITTVPANLRVEGVQPESQLFKCKMSTKDFLVLRTRGTIQQQAYHHGMLLGKDARATGVPAESIKQVEGGLKEKPKVMQVAVWGLVECLSNRLLASTSTDFSESVSSFYEGYLASFDSAKLKDFDRHDCSKNDPDMPLCEARYKFAGVGIELSNLLSGIKYQAKTDKLGVWKRIRSCVPTIKLRLAEAKLDSVRNKIRGYMDGAFDFLNLTGREIGGLGCTGFVMPGTKTQTGDLIHARNLDGDMVQTWNNHTLMILAEEYDQNGKPYNKYVSAGTAALFYSGGISGINDKGLSVALHQMYPVPYNIDVANNAAEMAPFLQQRILREASTIEEAIALVEKTTHFASWTIVIAERKGDRSRVARVEITADGIEAKIEEEQMYVQTNHFLHDFTAPRAYAPNYNKFQESRARFTMVTKALAEMEARGGANLQSAMDLVASHSDGLINDYHLANRTDGGPNHDQLRAFGRTPIKAYNVMTTQAVLGKDKTEFWITGGEINPAPHSAYIGFEIDFEEPGIGYTVKGEMKAKVLEGKPNYLASLDKYIAARQSKKDGNYFLAQTNLSEAIELAKADGVDELVYYYIRARVYHSLARAQDIERDADLRKLYFGKAMQDWQHVWSNRERMLPYQQALTAMFMNLTMLRLKGYDWKDHELASFEQRNSFAISAFNSATLLGADPMAPKAYRLHEETERNIGYVEKLMRAHEKLVDLHNPVLGLDFGVRKALLGIGPISKFLSEYIDRADDSDPDFVVIR